MEEMEYLKMLETILARHRAFGDSDYIHEQLQVWYKRRLNKISTYLPVAGRLLDALCRTDSYNRYRVIGDTVVRCAINDALRQFEMGTQHGLPIDACDEVFRAIISHLEEGKSEEPMEFRATQVTRLESGSYHGWVWSGEHSCDVFGRAFQYLIQERFGKLELCAPNADELAMLAKGAMLLNELLPLLSRSALSHTHLIAVFPEVAWKGAASMSQSELTGTIFLNRDLLRSPWWVAEHLLHESLHQKLYDFHHGHTLLEPDFSREDAPRVCSLWNVPGKNKSYYWDARRAVAAFHVYVHLALLSTIAEQRAPELENNYGLQDTENEMTDSRRAMERAHYLGEKIRDLCWQELGLAGKRLVEWLISVLNALDPSPPPRGSYIHLLFDRYQREALTAKKKIELSLNGEAKASSDLPQQLRKLIKDEFKSTRYVLSAAHAEADLSRFDSALDQFSDEELGTKFPDVRGIISKTILDLSPDGYGLRSSQPESNTLDEAVKEMVERSSERLHGILAE